MSIDRTIKLVAGRSGSSICYQISALSSPPGPTSYPDYGNGPPTWDEPWTTAYTPVPRNIVRKCQKKDAFDLDSRIESCVGVPNPVVRVVGPPRNHQMQSRGRRDDPALIDV